MNKIKNHLIDSLPGNPQCKKTKDEISQLCGDHEQLLNLWDGAFSEVQTIDPTEK